MVLLFKHLDGMQLNKIENKMLKYISKSISAHVFVHVGNLMQIKPMMCEWDDRANSHDSQRMQ